MPEATVTLDAAAGGMRGGGKKDVELGDAAADAAPKSGLAGVGDAVNARITSFFFAAGVSIATRPRQWLLGAFLVFLVNLLFFLYCMFLLRTYITGGLKVICSILMKGKTAKGGIRGSEGMGQGIHANPLIYRRTLVEKHETKNPLQLFEGEGSGAQGPVRFHPPPGLKKQPSNLVIELRQLRRHNSADRSRRLNRLASLRKRTDQERAETRSTSLPSKADDTVSSDNGVGWEVHVDSESGDFYYYNNVSNETTWERPPGVDPSFFHEKEKQLFQEV